ncbi:SRPBCC family protein [Modestobacter altitudinis]|uniref:SRPBCC family protein n=1 Tax=Modestobacter altitudinis TaxID=2213158 RepID=UPI00110CA3DB|nr:SRPBCC family protein [Modestobacter altitudinis]
MTPPISANGTSQVPFSRLRVWRALAVLQPYCAVCDVSYVVEGDATKEGTRFTCAPGRLDDRSPPPGAPRGQVVEWQPSRRVTTRLELTPEVWTTTIDLTDVPGGGTDVTITLTHQPLRGGHLRHRLRRGGVRKVAERAIESELAKIADHVRQAEQTYRDAEDGRS